MQQNDCTACKATVETSCLTFRFFDILRVSTEYCYNWGWGRRSCFHFEKYRTKAPWELIRSEWFTYCPPLFAKEAIPFS